MASSFAHPFPAGLWHDLVVSAVKSGGAQMDIFPSLHTAAPTVVALFSFRNRKELPFRYTWPLVAFCTLNIIIATMFLRWHYLIDVVAGLVLATTAVLLSRPITRWELARRERLGYGALWPEFMPAAGATKDYPGDATSVA
jgi:membrane-associated phospholipid phosphatase